MFLTGAAGTGKSEIIKELLIYAEALCVRTGSNCNWFYDNGQKQQW
jgi:hypothetical protein